MIGNTFGSKTRKFGGAFPVWKDVFSKVDGGGVFEKSPGVGEIIPAGTPVYLDKIGGVAKCLEFYEALAESTGTTLKVTVGMGLPTPVVGQFLMKVPDTLSGTGTGVKVNNVVIDGNVATVTLSADPDTLAEGDILTVAAASGATQKMAIADLSGFTKNDAYFEEGTEVATCAVVWSGKIYADRIQPIPGIFKALVPNILFQKEA